MTGKFGMFLMFVYLLMEDRTGAGWLQGFRVYAVLVEAEGTEGGTLALWYFDGGNLEIGTRLGLWFVNRRDIASNCAIYEKVANYLTATQSRELVKERSIRQISAHLSNISVNYAAQSHQIKPFDLIGYILINAHWHCGAQHGIRR